MVSSNSNLNNVIVGVNVQQGVLHLPYFQSSIVRTDNTFLVKSVCFELAEGQLGIGMAFSTSVHLTAW
jgi:hypothetical protein